MLVGSNAKEKQEDSLRQPAAYISDGQPLQKIESEEKDGETTHQNETKESNQNNQSDAKD